MSKGIQIIRDNGTVSKLNLYRSLCRNILMGNLTKRIENERTCYAQIVIQELIRSAVCYVDIFCQGDEDYFFENFTTIEELTEASDERGVDIRVISVRPMKQSLKSLFRRYDADIYEPTKENEGVLSKEVFFMVVDGKALHFENKLPKHCGVAYANNPEMANELQGVFNECLTMCKRI